MSEASAKRFYRIDKFVVPEAARDELLEKVHMTHELLRKQPGFIQDFLLEREAGPGKFILLTFVEWQDETVVASVRAKVAAMHRQMNFDPQEVLARLGVRSGSGKLPSAQRLEASARHLAHDAVRN